MTHDELGELLGRSGRTVRRYLVEGMPAPEAGESKARWAKRAQIWLAERAKEREGLRRRPGPKANEFRTAAEVAAIERYRAAKVGMLELRLAERRGDVHPKAECELDFVERCVELSNRLRQMPAKLATRLYPPRSMEAIKREINRELERCLAVLCDQ